MTILLKNWHFMRLLRAGFALWAITEAWRTGQWLLLVPGGIFAIQAIFDIGCCGASGCATPSERRYGRADSVSAQDVEFEEVKKR